MLWKNIFGDKVANYNLLISGSCACPGKISGRVHIWDNNATNCLEESDILLLLDATIEVPIWAIQRAGGIISCAHTTYSHLTSFSMALNKPCIVGAIFICLPENSKFVFIDSLENIVVYIPDNNLNNNIQFGKSSRDWFLRIGSKVCGKLYSHYDKPLAHVLVLDELEQYIDLISGLFFDSMIFQEQFHNIYDLEASIGEMYRLHPDIKIYYRFSVNAIKQKYNTQLKKEIEFVHSLQNYGISVHVFVPNVSTYKEVKDFRKFITLEFDTDITMKIGAMLENKEIVDYLDVILDDHLLDFAVVGMNDLMSSCLNLDRDDPKNQESFRMDAEPVSQALITIINALNAREVPCYIGYPKYSNFLMDYELLDKIGYSNFFGTYSLYVIAQEYRRS